MNITLLTSLTYLGLILMAAMVIMSDRKKKVNLALAIFIFCDLLWLISLELLNTSLYTEPLFARLVFVFALFLVASLVAFVNTISEKKFSLSTKLFLTGAAALVSLTMTDFIVVEALPTQYGLPLPVYGDGYLLYVLTVVIGALLAVRMLYRSGYTNVHKQTSQQARLVLGGVTFFALFSITTNIVIPNITHNPDIASLAPLGSLILVSVFAYAIVRHQLFNVRLVVARSLAYILVIMSFVSMYSLGIIILGSTFLDVENPPLSMQVIYGLFTVAGAFAFQPLKSFFDRVTNRIFYQDAYDPEEIINSLNTVFVSTLDVRELMNKVSIILQEELRVDYCVIGIAKNDYTKRIVVGTKEFPYKEEDLTTMRDIVKRSNKKILVSEHQDNSVLKRILERYNISIVGRLIDSSRDQEGAMGYVLLGPKKSGSYFSHKDIDFLETIVNVLLIGLQNSLRFEEIKEFSETLEKRIQNATKQLRSKNERLHELDQAKDDFISMASHQLRTPLTTIKGYLSMLEEGDFGKLSFKQQEIVSLTYTSAERMVYLIADLLNISRINTGRFVIERTSCNLVHVVNGEITQLQRAAKAKKIKLKGHVPKTFPTVLLDETKIRQVIMNLIDNAIYYTPSGKHVDVYLTLHKDNFEFKVVDTGIGVPEHDKQELFTKFFRANNARSARPDGTGLGLYMAKKVVTAQGGSVFFESKEGKGSTFGFRFSLAAVAAKK